MYETELMLLIKLNPAKVDILRDLVNAGVFNLHDYQVAMLPDSEMKRVLFSKPKSEEN